MSPLLLGFMVISRLIPPGNTSREGSLSLSVVQSPVVIRRFQDNTGIGHITKVRFQGWGVGSKKCNRKVQGVPQSQTAALSRPQEEEETDKSKQAQTEQTYEKH